VADTRIISIIGRKNAGKTTLVVALASEFIRKHRRVMTIKHADDSGDVDRPGSDSHRLLFEAKAERVVVAAPNLHAIVERSSEEADPVALTRRYLDGADIVLVEGFPNAPLPKVEVFRREASTHPIYSATAPNAEQWIAILTDDDKFDAPCPVLRFRDTMWLQLIANIVWDKALKV
jgi:molybdopterin-guanine dinucleotide biosynthesis protein B